MSFLGLHKRPKAQFSEIHPDIRMNNKRDVIETINSLGIPHDMLIVFGSSALTLLGLPRHAQDVDLIVHPDIINVLSDTQHLPNQTPVAERFSQDPVFRQFKAAALPLSGDLSSHHPTRRTFEETQRHRTIQDPASGLTLLRPMDLFLDQKSPIVITDTLEERRLKLAKKQYDIVLLSQWLDSHRD